MFLRWKRRTLQRPKYRGISRNGVSVLLSAVLTETVRIDGKPRQRVVKYLGSIQEWRIEQRAYYILRDFWGPVLSRLDSLDLPKKQRREIEKQIAEVVPKPTKAMLRENMKSLSRILKGVKK
jgi:hypothetical protein